MDLTNQLHSEFYDNHAYPFDVPHTIPEGWDADALVRTVVKGTLKTDLAGDGLISSPTTVSTDDTNNPV